MYVYADMAKGGRAPTPIGKRMESQAAGVALTDNSNAARNGNRDMEMLYPDGVDFIPPPPATLKVGNHGRRAWRTYWRDAGAWLEMADYEIIARLCLLIDQTDQMLEHLDKNGIFWTDEDGAIHASTVHGQYLRTIREMERLEDRLGLNPVERARIRVEPQKKGSPLDQWREGRAKRAH